MLVAAILHFCVRVCEVSIDSWPARKLNNKLPYDEMK